MLGGWGGILGSEMEVVWQVFLVAETTMASAMVFDRSHPVPSVIVKYISLVGKDDIPNKLKQKHLIFRCLASTVVGK